MKKGREQILQTKKLEIQEKGLDKISTYFDLNRKELTKLDHNILHHLLQMARLGMQFEREMNLSKRATERTQLNVARLIHESKEELKKYIKKTLPQYIQ